MRREKENQEKVKNQKEDEVKKILDRARRARSELEKELARHSDSSQEKESSIPARHKTVRYKVVVLVYRIEIFTRKKDLQHSLVFFQLKFDLFLDIFYNRELYLLLAGFNYMHKYLD